MKRLKYRLIKPHQNTIHALHQNEIVYAIYSFQLCKHIRQVRLCQVKYRRIIKKKGAW